MSDNYISVDISLASYDSSITPVMGLVAETLFPGFRRSGYICGILDVLGVNFLTSLQAIPFPSRFGIEKGGAVCTVKTLAHLGQFLSCYTPCLYTLGTLVFCSQVLPWIMD